VNDITDLIKQGFKQALMIKPYGQITISEICSNAGVSRRTFYNYFGSIDAIVASLVTDDFVTPVIELRKLLPLDNMKSSTLLGVEMLCQTLYDNRDFYIKMVEFRGRLFLATEIIQQTQALNSMIYEHYDLSSEEKEFIAYHIAASLTMTLLWWLENKQDIEPKRMAKYLSTWAFSHFREIGKRF
jgi:AcrR family transcriptional regulator